MTIAPVRVMHVLYMLRAAGTELAVVKLAAGVFGHTYALVADAVESTADIVASLVVWGGIAVAARPADDDHRLQRLRRRH